MPTFELQLKLPQFSESMYKKFTTLKLADYNAPFLEKKIMTSKMFSSSAEYLLHFQELKKYLALNFIHKTNFTMINRKVDAIWHQFMLFSREYHSFCEKYFGQYIHHNPADEDMDAINLRRLKIDAENFLIVYYQTFGELNDIWFS